MNQNYRIVQHYNYEIYTYLMHVTSMPEKQNFISISIQKYNMLVLTSAWIRSGWELCRSDVPRCMR